MPEKRDIQVILSELVRRMNEHSRRLRAIETRHAIIETRISSLEDAALRINEEIKATKEDNSKKIKKYDTSFLKIENDINKINKKMDRMARKSQLKELENLISLFNPLKTTFITREELERLLNERVR